jgi:hypothetical protein
MNSEVKGGTVEEWNSGTVDACKLDSWQLDNFQIQFPNYLTVLQSYSLAVLLNILKKNLLIIIFFCILRYAIKRNKYES